MDRWGWLAVIALVPIITISTVYSQGDWSDPPLVENGVPGITVTIDEQQRVILNIEEERSTNERAILINYHGTSKLTIIDVRPNYQITVDQDVDGTQYLIIAISPDFEISANILPWSFYLKDDNSVQRQIFVKLTNKDDNVPQVTLLAGSNCSVLENEETAIKTCVLLVNDLDGCAANTEFTISVQGADEVPFTIDFDEVSSKYPDCLNELDDTKSYQAYLSVIDPLDYETALNHFLTIAYKDPAGNMGASPVQVVVQVIDAPDQLPIWQGVKSTLSVNEEEPMVYTVRALDGDTQINASICYRLEFLDSEDEIQAEEKAYFSMGQTTGLLSIGGIERDRWERNSYTLNLIAEECLNKTSAVSWQIVILVIDSINKNLTYTIDGLGTDTTYPIQIFEENTIAALQYTVSVYDPDEGLNGTFTAEVDSPWFVVLPTQAFQNGTFTIQGTTLLDYENETQRNFDITLIATERKDTSHRITVPIKISVTNQNDNAPEFLNVEQDNYIHFSVREDATKGVIGKVEAIDADEGDIIEYQMAQYSGVTIDQSSGEISLTKMAFDYEQQPVVLIQVNAGDKKHTSYATLYIKIIDLNDTPPTVLVETPGSITVLENASISDTLAVSMSASDKDTTASLNASIDWENTYAYKDNTAVNHSAFDGWFEVTATKNLPELSDISLTLTVAKTLDWGIVDTLQLRILVTDENTEINQEYDYATLNIIIKDVNDHAPTCVDGQWSMPENSSQSLTIGTFTANDIDGPGNNNVIYFLQDPEEDRIVIDQVTGLISTGPGSRSVDFEKEETFSVAIIAADGVDEGSLSSTCQIVINVQDVNDEIPIGEAKESIINIPEDIRNGPLTMIMGHDDDKSEEFKTIRYALRSFSNYFSVADSLSGIAEVTVNIRSDLNFDYDEGDRQYQLAVVLTDYPDDPTGGANQHSSTTTITVNIDDVNDNLPIFENPNDQTCLFRVSESDVSAQGITLTDKTKIVANDIDSGNNSWIDYAIESVECDAATLKDCYEDKDSLFVISGNANVPTAGVKADVKSGKNLIDRYGSFNVNVTAIDHGEPPLSSWKIFRFCIEDVNNNAPIFVYPDVEAITVRQDLETDIIVEDTTGQPIPLITVKDLDFDKNGIAKLSVSPDDFFTIQSFGENQGQLQLQDGADFTQFVETTLTLKACDTPDDGTEPNCATKPFTLRPRFLNEVEPIFTTSTFDALFQENSTIENVVIPEAEDRNNDNVEDNSQKQKIYYYITSDDTDIQEYFLLDSVNGKLTLKKPLDASVRDNYTILVQASNKDTQNKLPQPNPASVLSINVTVIDINDKFPVFSREAYSISISISDQGRNVLTVNAWDPDRGDTLQYSIDPKSLDSSHVDVPINPEETFIIDPKIGVISVKQYPTQATSGYIKFVVSATDGVHTSNVNVVIYLVSEHFLIPSEFQDSETDLAAHLDEVVNKFSEFFAMTCVPGRTNYKDSYTTLQVHFEKENKPVEPDDLDIIKNNVTAMQELREFLRINYNLHLNKFGNDATPIETSDGINTALIAVTVVLVVLLIALAAFHFFKTRSLSNLISRLTHAANPQDDKKVFALPNTNQHVDVGSNPLWNTEIVRELDSASSTGSDDSGLIGIEDNPEFQSFYNDFILKTTQKTSVSIDDDILRDNPQLRGLGLNNTADINY